MLYAGRQLYIPCTYVRMSIYVGFLAALQFIQKDFQFRFMRVKRNCVGYENIRDIFMPIIASTIINPNRYPEIYRRGGIYAFSRTLEGSSRRAKSHWNNLILFALFPLPNVDVAPRSIRVFFKSERGALHSSFLLFRSGIIACAQGRSTFSLKSIMHVYR